MRFPRALGIALMLCFLLLSLLQSHHSVVAALDSTAGAVAGGVGHPAAAPSPGNINCGAECGRRCSKSSRKDKCNRACMSCCHTCACVPPGTYGNVDVCPCYANLLNPKNGVHKCP